jgi:hypothetical protein
MWKKKEKYMVLFHRIAGFCRRLFSSKGFRRGLYIFFGISVAYYLYNMIIFLNAMQNVGVSFGEALRFYFHLSLFDMSRIPVSASIALGIAVGLVWYFSRKRRNREEAEPEENAEKSSDDVREEEIIETTHYKYH